MSISIRALFTAALALALAACGDSSSSESSGSDQVLSVGVIEVNPRPVTQTKTLPGRLEARRVALVRAQVSGVIQKRLFEEGSQVEAGQTLFQIDAAPYQAALESAEAQVQRADATLDEAEYEARRFRRLYKDDKAVSERQYIQARSAYKRAQAELADAEAARRSAAIELEYASVSAPIAGRIGRAQVTEGALVGKGGDTTVLATIQQIDPLYVSFTQSGSELLKLKRAYEQGKLKLMPDNQAVPVTLHLDDGTQYPHSGRLLFTNVNVDPDTGRVSLRALVPNPEQHLRPGMYVRVTLPVARYDSAYVIPKQTVIRNDKGDTVYVLQDDDTVSRKSVNVAGSQGHNWLISGGLNKGDRVLANGFQKIQEGSKVRPQPWENPIAADKAADGATTDGNDDASQAERDE